jgi:hypothetical protein
MPLGNSLPYGLRDVKVVQYPTLEAIAFGGTLTDLPVARTFSFNETEEYDDLRGDDALQTSHGQGPQSEWELESGGISFGAYASIAGGVVVETGIAPNQRKRYRKKVTDQRPFFTAMGQAISDSGGDFHGIVWRCRATGNIEAQLADTEFMIPTVSGIGFPCKVSGMVGGLEILDSVYDFVQNETITALTLPVLDTPAAPVVYSLSDQTSVLAGGEIVQVTGNGFTGTTAVTVGGTAATDFEVHSNTKIWLITPPKAAGAHNVIITTPAGASATGTQTVITYA